MRPGDKPYFPFLLGNGVDAVLIDYSGSMVCNSGHLHTEQHQGAICAWYKATHRGFSKPVPPIIQSAYFLIASGGENYEVGSFDQRFDPFSAVLTTKIEATDFKLRLETFLTHEQVLVEHYTVLKLPPDNPKIGFGFYPIGASASFQFSWKATQDCIMCDYKADEIRGTGVMFLDYGKGVPGGFFGGQRLIYSCSDLGREFTRYLLLVDNRDFHNYREQAKNVINRIRHAGYLKLRKRHAVEWLGYQRNSKVVLPDKQMEYLYYLSLYQLKAHQNFRTGLISIGNYPQLWGGGVTNSWDLIFPHQALLGANRTAEAEALISGYREVMPIARGYAAQMKSPGAYFAWFMNHQGYSLDFKQANDFPHIEKFNNGCLVMEAWSQYAYTGDRNQLAKNFDMIRETADFLIHAIVKEDGTTAFIREEEGADESVPRKNDTLHLITTLKAVETVALAADVLARPVGDRYRILAKKLRDGLSLNCRNKILLPFRDAHDLPPENWTNLKESPLGSRVAQGGQKCEANGSVRSRS